MKLDIDTDAVPFDKDGMPDKFRIESALKDHETANYERRKHDAVIAMSQQLHDVVMSLRAELAEHMVNETKELAAMVTSLLQRSFPEGDPEGHRKYHEASIARAEASAKFWQTLSLEIAKYGLIGFIGWAVYALWNAFLVGPHK
jgi:hypothetical protein